MTKHYTGRAGGWPDDLNAYELGDVIEDSRGIKMTVAETTYDGCGHKARIPWLGERANPHTTSPQIYCRQCGHPGATGACVPAAADVLKVMRERSCTQDEAVVALGGQP